MGVPSPPENALPFAAVFSSFPSLLEEVVETLAGKWDRPLHASGAFRFDETEYYRGEMGWPLVKEIYLFPRAMDPGSIAEVKLMTNRLESALSREGKRRVNVDPGYLTTGKVVLATTKNHAHRIYVGNGIYCEVTLSWRKGTFEPFPWTYPDYRRPEVIAFFNRCRSLLKARSRSSRSSC